MTHVRSFSRPKLYVHERFFLTLSFSNIHHSKSDMLHPYVSLDSVLQKGLHSKMPRVPIDVLSFFRLRNLSNTTFLSLLYLLPRYISTNQKAACHQNVSLGSVFLKGGRWRCMAVWTKPFDTGSKFSSPLPRLIKVSFQTQSSIYQSCTVISAIFRSVIHDLFWDLLIISLLSAVCFKKETKNDMFCLFLFARRMIQIGILLSNILELSLKGTYTL